MVLAGDAAQLPRAQEIAIRLDLPLEDGSRGEPDGLVLWVGRELRLGSRALGYLTADWTHGRFGYRLRQGARQGLSRAIGVRPDRPPPTVLDATAGLGHDAALLAAAGCSVVAVERCPLVELLLEDALAQAQADPELAGLLGDRLRLRAGDSLQLLQSWHAEPPDVVYLDPMHPPRKKSAQVRKEMRIFREVVGDDADSTGLVEAARALARKRVVVKRPAHAPPLAAGVTRTRKGRTTRYDLYLPQE